MEHAAIWRDIAGLPAAPDTVAKGLTPDETAATAAQFLTPPASTSAPPSAPRTGGGGAAQGNLVRRLGDG